MLDGKYNITDPAEILAYGADPDKLNAYGIPACAVPEMDRDDPRWSHSLHCDNDNYVLDTTQATKTAYSVLNALGTILFLPTGGHVGDAWGRKKVLFWTGFVSVMITFCYWLDTIDLSPPGDLHGALPSKNCHSFKHVRLCLSRACLGKAPVFKWKI